MNKNRRPQKAKARFVAAPRNEEFAMATITRHAAAARPVPSAKAYRRKPKHGRNDW